jgi:hypothetical protein
MLGHNTTFVLSAESLGILDWFQQPAKPAAGKAPGPVPAP